jgi:hypothetical protein
VSVDAAGPQPRIVKLALVLGDGSTIDYRVELGEVARLPFPEQLLATLRDQHFVGFQVTEDA